MLQKFARWMLARLGWSLDFNGFPGPRGILIVYPHTSNWDFIFGLLAKWAMGLNLTWIGKESLFRGFTGATLGRLMRLWGGRPVNRHQASGAVEQWAQLIESEPWCWLTLSPEGTRKHQDHLRSGFYHLALRTALPVGRRLGVRAHERRRGARSRHAGALLRQAARPSARERRHDPLPAAQIATAARRLPLHRSLAPAGGDQASMSAQIVCAQLHA
jgi:hypothetical protein